MCTTELRQRNERASGLAIANVEREFFKNVERTINALERTINNLIFQNHLCV
jgi:hypothetical protein